MPFRKFVPWEGRQEQKRQRCGRLNVSFFIFCFTVVTIDYGLATEKVGLGKEGFRAIIAFIIGIGLIIMFEFYLFITKINKEKRTVSSNNSRGKR